MSSSPMGSILTVLGFRRQGESEQKAYNAALDTTSKGAKNADKNVATMSKGLAVAGKAIAAVGAAALSAARAIGSMAVDFARTGDEIAKTSVKLGIASKDLQELRYAAGGAGVSTEGLQGGLAKLGLSLSDAVIKPSGEAAKALRALGLDADELSGMDATQRMGVLADALNRIDDEATRSKVAVSLFGKGATELRPLLAGGSAEIDRMAARAHKLGGVMTDDALKGAEAMGDGLTDLGVVMDGMRNQIGAAVAPAIAEFADGLANVIAENKDLISQDLPAALKDIASGLVSILPAIADAIREFGQFVKLVKEFGSYVQTEFPIVAQAFESYWWAITHPIEAIQTAVQTVIDKVDELLGMGGRLQAFAGRVGAAVGLVEVDQNADMRRGFAGVQAMALGDKAPGAEAKIHAVTPERSSADLRKIADDPTQPPSARAKASEFAPMAAAREAQREAAMAQIMAANAEAVAVARRAQGAAASRRARAEVGEPRRGGGGRRKPKPDAADAAAPSKPSAFHGFEIRDADGNIISRDEDATRSPVASAQVVRIDATYNAPTQVDITIDGMRVAAPSGALGEAASHIRQMLEERDRKAFDHYRLAVQP